MITLILAFNSSNRRWLSLAGKWQQQPILWIHQYGDFDGFSSASDYRSANHGCNDYLTGPYISFHLSCKLRTFLLLTFRFPYCLIFFNNDKNMTCFVLFIMTFGIPAFIYCYWFFQIPSHRSNALRLTNKIKRQQVFSVLHHSLQYSRFLALQLPQ